jgi:hypothetical protein
MYTAVSISNFSVRAQALASFCFSTFLFFCVSPATADQVKINNIWIPQVDIIGIEDGNLQYVTPGGGDSSRPMSEVQGIRLEKYPDYEKATQQIEQQEYAAAVPLLAGVRKEARGKDDWVANEAGMKMAMLLNELGMGEEAAEAYLELVNQAAPAYFLSAPPIQSVAELPQAKKVTTGQLLERAARRVEPAARENIQALIAATQGAAPAGDANASTESGSNDTPSTSNTPSLNPTSPGLGNQNSYPADAAVLLPERLTPNDLGNLVVEGKYQQAIEMADGLMRSLPRAETIYLKAKAQLALAEKQGDDQKMLKDSALNFMRVVIYFPQPYGGPSLLEAAYIHEKLGLEERAQQLYESAGRALDPESDPRYYKRYEQLTGG